MSAESTNDDAFEALQQFADVWHNKYAKSGSAGENRKPPSLTMRAGGVAAVLTEPQLQAAVAEYARTLRKMRDERNAAQIEAHSLRAALGEVLRAACILEAHADGNPPNLATTVTDLARHMQAHIELFGVENVWAQREEVSGHA